MKAIRGARELEAYGIDVLTGEACGVGMRVLCDVTPAGEALLSGLLGGMELKAAAWNGRDGAEKSIMLPRAWFPDIAAYALLAVDHCAIVLKSPYLDDPGVKAYPGSLAWGMTLEEWEDFRQRATFAQWRYSRYIADGTAADGLRNRHEMSGRVY